MSDRFDLREAACDAIAIADHEELTYAELHALARERAESFLRAGLDVARGDRIMLVPQIDRESIVSLLAALDLRAPIVLAHPRWRPPELARAIALSQPRLIVRETIEVRDATPHERSPAFVVFTTGSSGTPKAACLSRNALLAAAEAHAAILPWRDGDRWKLAMPLAHVGGLGVVLRCLWARKTIALGERPSTLLSVVPAMLDRLERGPRAILVGGAACPSATLARLRSEGWPLLPTYGLTEMAGQVCTQRIDDPRPHGVGPPLPGVEVRIVDGEIQTRGATRMEGFLGDPPIDDWYRTGDLGEMIDGHLHVHGRIDDRIVTGGENVDPLEVEDALTSHPRVRACCVVGTDDPRWGQSVAALIVGDVSEHALRAHLDERLARFKHPRRWAFAAALPLAGGKVDRHAVRGTWNAPSPADRP